MIRFTELKNTNRHNLMEVLPLAKPFTVLIEPSSCCNFRCVQCFQRITRDCYFTQNRMNMPLERFRVAIDQLKSWSGPKIKVLKLSMYGEPLIHPEFSEMLRIAGEADVADRIETTTNASLLTPEVAEQMVTSQLDYARVSIYAPEQKLHEKVTGTNFDITRIHENLRVLQEIKRKYGSEKPFVSAKMLDMYNEENDRFKQLYGDVADEVFIDKPHSWIKTGDSDFLQNYYEKDIGKATEDMKQHCTKRIACPMPFTTMAVRSNGDVAPCCVDFIGGTNLGNMEQATLEKIWNSDNWYEFQKMQLEDRKHENYSCSRCDIYLSDHYTRDNIDGFDVSKLKRNG